MLCEALANVEQVRNANLLEVIVVDDGSSEPYSVRILSEIAKAGDCVRVARDEFSYDPMVELYENTYREASGIPSK
jgi:glycosyltransferase involved in cell wall biosynthesis